MKRIYKCQFCGKTFKRDTWYNKHKCEKKKRFLESHNIDTIQAHRLFQHWQRKSGLVKAGREKDMEEFCKSPFFNAFKKLVVFAREQNLTSAYRYVDWLVDHQIEEVYWADEECLEYFRDYVRKVEEPKLQLERTLEAILEWADSHNQSPREFYQSVTDTYALRLIRENRFSPWVMFSHEACLVEFMDRLDAGMLTRIDEIINIRYWTQKIELNPDTTTWVDSYMNEVLEIDGTS